MIVSRHHQNIDGNGQEHPHFDLQQSWLPPPPAADLPPETVFAEKLSLACRYMAEFGFDRVTSVFCRPSTLCGLIYNHGIKRSGPTGLWATQYWPIRLQVRKTSRVERSSGAPAEEKNCFRKKRVVCTTCSQDRTLRGAVPRHTPTTRIAETVGPLFPPPGRTRRRMQEGAFSVGWDAFRVPLKTVQSVGHVSVTVLRSHVGAPTERLSASSTYPIAFCVAISATPT